MLVHTHPHHPIHPSKAFSLYVVCYFNLASQGRTWFLCLNLAQLAWAVLRGTAHSRAKMQLAEAALDLYKFNAHFDGIGALLRAVFAIRFYTAAPHLVDHLQGLFTNERRFFSFCLGTPLSCSPGGCASSLQE